jgi:hypothetical protein
MHLACRCCSERCELQSCTKASTIVAMLLDDMSCCSRPEQACHWKSKMHEKASAKSIHLEMNETTTIQLPSFLDPDLCCDPFKTHSSQGLKPLQGSGTCAPVVAPNQRKPTLFANAGVLTATSRGPSGSRRK